MSFTQHLIKLRHAKAATLNTSQKIIKNQDHLLISLIHFDCDDAITKGQIITSCHIYTSRHELGFYMPILKFENRIVPPQVSNGMGPTRPV